MKVPVTAEPSKELVIQPSPRLVPTLTAADRCDRCGKASRAYVAVTLPVPDEGLLRLYFCGHHFAEYEAALREKAVLVVDERWVLDEAEKAKKADVPAYLTTVKRGGI